MSGTQTYCHTLLQAGGNCGSMGVSSHTHLTTSWPCMLFFVVTRVAWTSGDCPWVIHKSLKYRPFHPHLHNNNCTNPGSRWMPGWVQLKQQCRRGLRRHREQRHYGAFWIAVDGRTKQMSSLFPLRPAGTGRLQNGFLGICLMSTSSFALFLVPFPLSDHIELSICDAHTAEWFSTRAQRTWNWNTADRPAGRLLTMLTHLYSHGKQETSLEYYVCKHQTGRLAIFINITDCLN